MRLGSEVLVDVAVEPPEGVDPPRPDQTVAISTARGEAEVTVWSVPLILHPEGVRLVNLQFRQEDLGGHLPAEGDEILW